jgi:hypothetical protein
LFFGATSSCSASFEDDLTGGTPSACGDGVLGASEVCDDGLPVTATCASLVGATASGTVRCTACGFDLRGCSQVVPAGGNAGAAGAGAAGISGSAGGAGVGGGSAGQGGGSAGQGGGGESAGASGAAAAGAGDIGGSAGAGTGGLAGGGSGSGSGGSGSGGSGSGGGGSGGAGQGGVAGAAGASAGAGGEAAGAAGGGTTCQAACPPFFACVDGECACPSTSLATGAGCWPKTPSAPVSRTKEEVCEARAMGNTRLSLEQPPPVAACARWLPPAEAVADNTNHYNYLRWLAGLAPVSSATGPGPGSPDDAACAMASSFDPSFQAGGQCVTPEALAVASQSIRYQGTGWDAVYDAILDDQNNAGSLISRRFLLHPNTSSVGWGAFQNLLSGGACVRVPFGAMPPVTYGRVIWPPPGFVPIELAAAPWTVFPAEEQSGGNPKVKVVRSPPGTSLNVDGSVQTDAGTLSPSLLLERVNWVPVVARSYAVTLDHGTHHLEWTFEPIACD